jgi:ABC-type Fe3+ transport system permease subunit
MKDSSRSAVVGGSAVPAVKRRRTRKLINTKLQLKLTLWVMGVATLTMLFQFFILTTVVSRMALDLPHDSNIFLDGLLETLMRSFVAALAISLSLTFVAGVLLTHRVAGPIYRFTKFLESVKRGERPADCRIRRNDELQDFCQLLNEATAPMRGSDAFETPRRAA